MNVLVFDTCSGIGENSSDDSLEQMIGREICKIFLWRKMDDEIRVASEEKILQIFVQMACCPVIGQTNDEC